MLILKGEKQKSIVINTLQSQLKGNCIVLSIADNKHNDLLFEDSYFCDKDFINQKGFKNYLYEILNNKHYDWLLIYTNFKESELKEIIKFVNELEGNYISNSIITCK